jgi:hypothetical protein
VYCWIAVGKGSDGVFREPCCFPRAFKGDGEDGCVLIFWENAGKVFRYEAIVDVLAEVFRCEMVCLKLIYVVYCFV